MQNIVKTRSIQLNYSQEAYLLSQVTKSILGRAGNITSETWIILEPQNLYNIVMTQLVQQEVGGTPSHIQPPQRDADSVGK